MDAKTYRRTKLILFLILLVSVGWSFVVQRAFAAFFGIGVFLVVVTLLRARVQGVLVDERQLEISGKAAQISFQALMPLLLLASVALMTGAGEEDFHYMRGLGIVLSYVTCLGLVIYRLMYWYFDRQTGGRGR